VIARHREPAYPRTVDAHEPEPEDEDEPTAWQRFEQRWLPEGVPWSHALLFDFDRAHAFVPDAAQLEGCLREYLALVRGVAVEQPFELLDDGAHGASELVLAYLARSGASVDAALAGDLAAALAAATDRMVAIVAQAEARDAFKRLRAIHEQLTERTCAAAQFELPRPAAAAAMQPTWTPEDELLHAEDTARVDAALRTLPERHQRVLRLRFDGRDDHEIAAVLGVAPVDMRGIMNRAIASLRQALAKLDPAPP
jgi:RNA polymerase sigma factor (sigma-70 family)